jgi:hypothetical protein
MEGGLLFDTKVIDENNQEHNVILTTDDFKNMDNLKNTISDALDKEDEINIERIDVLFRITLKGLKSDPIDIVGDRNNIPPSSV